MTPPVDISTPSESQIGDALEVLLIDGSGSVIALSHGAAKYLGRPQHELQGRSLSALFGREIHPAFPWLDELANAGSPLPPLLLHLEHQRPEIASIHVEAVLYAIETGVRGKGETVAGLAIRPSTGAVVESELLTAQRQILELVAQRSSLSQTLTAVAKFSEKVLPSEVFCLLTPISEDGVLGDGLCPTLPSEIQNMLGLFGKSIDAAPGLFAIHTGQRVLANDLEQDPRWSTYAQRLRSHGLVSVWSFPIRDSKKISIRALLEFHLPVRRGPNRAELNVIDELSELVRLAIDLHQLLSDLDMSESSAQEKGDLLKTVINTALDAVVSIDLHGKINLWNKQAELLFGWTDSEVLGKPLTDTIIPPSLVKAHQEGMHRYHTQGVGPILGKRTEITAMKRNGIIFPVELTVNPHAGGFSAFIRDISESRRKETEAKATEERLKLVIEASSDGFWDYRFDGAPSVVSDRCATMLGYKSGEVSLTTPDVNLLIHPEDAPSVKQTWDAHLAGKTSHYESQHRRRASNGAWHWILDRGKVVERAEGGKALRITGTQTDITERRSLEVSLGAAERMESLGLLASGFAHELNSVLSIIRAHASLANITTGLPSKAVESLEVIQLAVAGAKAMSRNLILLGEGEHLGASAPAIVVSDAVRDAVRLLSPNLPRTISVVVKNLTDGRERVAIDSSRMQQAILNLLMRSTEALANTGLITLRISQALVGAEPLTRVECIDQGEPLNADQQIHAFEALAPDGSLRGRTAMGLAAVKRFAESAGGHATVSVGAEGTTFCISLPTVAESFIQDRLPIVLAENHPLLRPMLVEALQATGYSVSTVENNVELLAAVKHTGGRCVLILDQASITGSLREVLDGIHSGVQPMPPVILLCHSATQEIVPGIPISQLQKPYKLEDLLNEIVKVSLPHA